MGDLKAIMLTFGSPSFYYWDVLSDYPAVYDKSVLWQNILCLLFCCWA